jgi:hypothetical protein
MWLTAIRLVVLVGGLGADYNHYRLYHSFGCQPPSVLAVAWTDGACHVTQ